MRCDVMNGVRIEKFFLINFFPFLCSILYSSLPIIILISTSSHKFKRKTIFICTNIFRILFSVLFFVALPSSPAFLFLLFYIFLNRQLYTFPSARLPHFAEDSNAHFSFEAKT